MTTDYSVNTTLPADLSSLVGKFILTKDVGRYFVLSAYKNTDRILCLYAVQLEEVHRGQYAVRAGEITAWWDSPQQARAWADSIRNKTQDEVFKTYTVSTTTRDADAILALLPRTDELVPQATTAENFTGQFITITNANLSYGTYFVFTHWGNQFEMMNCSSLFRLSWSQHPPYKVTREPTSRERVLDLADSTRKEYPDTADRIVALADKHYPAPLTTATCILPFADCVGKFVRLALGTTKMEGTYFVLRVTETGSLATVREDTDYHYGETWFPDAYTVTEFAADRDRAVRLATDLLSRQGSQASRHRDNKALLAMLFPLVNEQTCSTAADKPVYTISISDSQDPLLDKELPVPEAPVAEVVRPEDLYTALSLKCEALYQCLGDALTGSTEREAHDATDHLFSLLLIARGVLARNLSRAARKSQQQG